ncbi:DUF6210 family protein [Porticoccus sp. W117]|uniref:DUF6210 family protein n=1 Tax=Porticoccus sp. W117 TaxID=3054777 RepID=UPI002598F56E|nr:DUF6210 family protein [Porticoccus sp. W117]MDM3869876.1 DUF6210 family protein [Porticoccus sp. W117]
MKKVKLWEISGAALIVQESTGVYFTNQVCGTACLQRELEGVLIPINNDMVLSDPEHLENQLCSLFPDGSDGLLNEEKADGIDTILQKYPETKGIRVNRSLIHQSVESWIFVIAKETEFGCYSGFGEIKGVLTWQNSD